MTALRCLSRAQTRGLHAEQDSAVAHYHAFIDMAAGLDATREGLSGVAARLEALAGALPNLAAASERFTAAAQDFSAQRARTKQLHRAPWHLLATVHACYLVQQRRLGRWSAPWFVCEMPSGRCCARCTAYLHSSLARHK